MSFILLSDSETDDHGINNEQVISFLKNPKKSEQIFFLKIFQEEKGFSEGFAIYDDMFLNWEVFDLLGFNEKAFLRIFIFEFF